MEDLLEVLGFTYNNGLGFPEYYQKEYDKGFLLYVEKDTSNIWVATIKLNNLEIHFLASENSFKEFDTMNSNIQF